MASARNVNSSANNSHQFDSKRLRIPDGHDFMAHSFPAHLALMAGQFGWAGRCLWVGCREGWLMASRSGT
jgi:hypothetical protein